MSRDHPNYSIVEIGQNTKKSLRDSRRLVTRTPVKKLLANANLKNSQMNKIIVIIILIRRPDQATIKRTCWIVFFVVTVDHRMKNKKQTKKKKKQTWKERLVFGPCLRTKKVMEHEGECETSYNSFAWNDTQRFFSGSWKSWKSEDGQRPSKLQHCHPEYWEESWRLEKTCCPSDSGKKNH